METFYLVHNGLRFLTFKKFSAYPLQWKALTDKNLPELKK